MTKEFSNEDNKSSRSRQGKRLLAVYGTCKIELKKELNLLFSTFEEAIQKSNDILQSFPLHCRSRALEASIVQSRFAEVLMRNFGDSTFFGKYRRIILRVKGYLILFKKLDKKGYPMNIKTQNVNSILNQDQVLELFNEHNSNDEPILYFGYQKNRIGEYTNPQLVYIDEEKIKFTIGKADIETELRIANLKRQEKAEPQPEAKPKLKGDPGLRKVN